MKQYAILVKGGSRATHSAKYPRLDYCSSIQAHQWTAHRSLPHASEPGVFLTVEHLTRRCRGLHAQTTHQRNISAEVSRSQLLRRETSLIACSLESARR